MQSTKTRIPQIQVGDVIDFDAHTGCTVLWERETVDFSAKATGQHQVVSISNRAGYTNARTGNAVVWRIDLDNGESIRLSSGSKLPVVSAHTTNTTHEPADPGDVRFELVNIGAETEDPQMQVLVLTIDDTGAEVARDVYSSEAEAYDMIEAHREAQAYTLEERFDLYAERGW